jgi:hypothetical protein
MEENTNTGFIESRSRVMEELLTKTAFKDSLRLFLKNINPDASPQLVRTLLGTDIEVPLSVVGSLPAAANCFIKAGMELVVQVRGKFSPPLLASFVESLLEDVDKETLACLITEIKDLVKDLAPAFQSFLKAMEGKPAQGKDGL